MSNEQVDKWQTRTLAGVCGLMLAMLLVLLLTIRQPDTKPTEQDNPVEQYAQGWVKDDRAITANLSATQSHFDKTPAGRAVTGDVDVFLWRAVRKVNDKPDSWYPNVDQKDVGCCVGCGWKHCSDIVQAVQILNGQWAQWKPVSVEAIYGASRVEIGGGRIRGDGSLGAWAKDAAEKVGTLAMEPYPGVDLSQFSPARARQWGRDGVPDALEVIAKQHTIKGCALVKSWTDVKKAISQGYPVAVCSDQGFAMTRDKDGFCRASGSWAHCMAIIGVRVGNREGGFILNSWGDSAHGGPVWPADAPVAGFWADAAVIDRMVRQGDSFALADAVGFPARNDFWIAVPRSERSFVRRTIHKPEWNLAP